MNKVTSFIFKHAMHRNLCLTVLLAILASSLCSQQESVTTESAGSSSSKQHFVIGGWIPGNADTLLSKWKPIFETYLTLAVGPLYSPPIEFELVPVDYDEEHSVSALYEAGKLDFVYSTPGSLTCLETQYDFAPIATQRQLILEKETGAIGSVIYSLASNDAIHDFKDFVGKKIGVGQTHGVGTFQLGYEVVFYQSDYTRQLEDLLAGRIDVAFAYSGWLETNHPEAVPRLRFHRIQQGLEFESEAFPFATSTPLVPQFGLSAAPSIPWQLRQQVMRALSALGASPVPAASAPAAPTDSSALALASAACRAAGVATFTMPASYVSVRTLAEDLGILYTEHTERRCHNQFESAHAFVRCPTGYVKADADADACAAAGLPCPAGLQCLCRPCTPELPVNVFPWEVVLGLCCGLFAVGFAFSVCWRAPLGGDDAHYGHASPSAFYSSASPSVSSFKARN